MGANKVVRCPDKANESSSPPACALITLNINKRVAPFKVFHSALMATRYITHQLKTLGLDFLSNSYDLTDWVDLGLRGGNFEQVQKQINRGVFWIYGQ